MIIAQETLEQIYGKMVCEQPISFQDTSVFGDRRHRTINFQIYDGFAYCPDYEGNEYILTYPKKEFVNTCKEMQQSIREFLALAETDQICVTDIVQSYCQLSKI